MIKLTKKQAEIVNQIREIEQETSEKVYLMYNHGSNKIHAVIVKYEEGDKIKGFENKGILCTHNVATTMMNKGIIVPEVVGKAKKFQNREELYEYELCRVNESI